MSIQANGCTVVYVTSTTCLSSSIRGASSFSRLMMRPIGEKKSFHNEPEHRKYTLRLDI